MEDVAVSLMEWLSSEGNSKHSSETVAGVVLGAAQRGGRSRTYLEVCSSCTETGVEGAGFQKGIGLE